MRTLILALVFFWLTPAADASFRLPEGQACATLPFRLVDNRAVYDVLVEDRGPYQFIFDTGANSILDAGLAREMGVALDSAGQTGGAGAGTQATWRTRLKSVSFGKVTGDDVDFLALDLSEIRKAIGFARLDGLMGREVLAQFLVRYVNDASTLTICDPKHAPASMREGTALPFDWTDEEIPIVTATFDGAAGKFIVDTGDRSSLTLFGPFVKAEGLRSAYTPMVSTITGRGVGGPIPADVVKGRALAFSAFSIPGVTTRMPTLVTGGFASKDLAGSIGNGVMRRFNTTYDYSARTMYLQPNSFFSKPDRYDRSGMWLTGERPDSFTVAAVSFKGPAALAGVETGDLIVAVDGKSVTGVSLISLRDRLMDAAPGTQVQFTLQTRVGVRRNATVVLADQI